MLDHQAALDDLIAEYLELVDAGQPVPPEEFVADRPELRDDFLKFVKQNGILQDWIAPAVGGLSAQELLGDPDLGFTEFAGFNVMEVLGRGGMGIVYHAIQQTDGRPIALKVLRQFGNSNQTQRTRFRREARAIESLRHPHIVPLVGSDEAQGTLFLAMQLIDGVTIADVIADQTSNSKSTEPASGIPATACGDQDSDQRADSDRVPEPLNRSSRRLLSGDRQLHSRCGRRFATCP